MKTRMLLTLLLLLSCRLTAGGCACYEPHHCGYHKTKSSCQVCQGQLCMPEEYTESVENYRKGPVGGRQVKIGDLIEICGEDQVKLTGFGVVSGLNGTGDSGEAAVKMLLSVAKQQGIRITIDDIELNNLALVTISAEIDPYERNFDVAVKSVGDAKSLQNGFLEASTLSPIGCTEVFAVASGSLALGARYFEANPARGAVGGTSSVTIGHPTVGFVIDGGQLTRDLPAQRVRNDQVELVLKHPNDRTATNIADAINEYMNEICVRAEPENASVVNVFLEDSCLAKSGNLTRLLADIGDLPTMVSRRAVITVDQGSGVIAMTEGVKMEPGSIAVAGLTVTVSSQITPVTRQGLYNGETSFIDQPELQVTQDQANFLTMPAGTDLSKVQQTLNALRLTPTSIISVFNAMHRAGMIHADIVVLPR